MTRAQNLAVIVTCLIAAMTYAGAVTMDGMGLFVLPGVVGAALIGSYLAARRMSGVALILGGVLVLAWAELVNIWSGTASGPAARSTAVAAACTLVAVVVARWDSPALFLLAIAASVCGALLLGAGSEVRSVAVAAVVSSALTLGWIERSRRRWTAPPRRSVSLVLLSLLVGGIAAGFVVLQAQREVKPPEALAAGQAYPKIKPPWKDPLGSPPKFRLPPPPPGRGNTPRSRGAVPQTQQPKTPTHHAHTPPPKSAKHPTSSQPHAPQAHRATQPHQPHPPPHPKHHPKPLPHPKPKPHPRHSPASRDWLYVLAAVLLILDALAARVLAVRFAWTRLRRRLSAGAPAEAITGAWAWARIRLQAYRHTLPASASPDVIADGRTAVDLPEPALASLQRLAASTTAAAFGSGSTLAASDAATAWKAADEVEAGAREALPRRTRTLLALRGPRALIEAR